MQPTTVSPTAKIQTYATKFPRLTPIELAKLPANGRQACARRWLI